jgi:PBSX family phage terminase large subunit
MGEIASAVASYAPWPWQVAPWRSKAAILLLTGSAGGGKSRIAAEKVHGYMLKYPRAQGLMLRKTRESMVNSTVLFYERAVVGRTPFCTHVPSKHRFEYVNGSLLAYGGMKDEEQREQIRSIGQAGGVDIAWVEEATELSRADFDELLARMRGAAAPWRQVILSCNPDADTHWINKDLIVGSAAEVVYSSAKDNPANPADYQRMLDMLTGIRRDRLRDGKWVAAEGLVWDNYDPAVHLIDRFPIPKEWRRIRVVDFGYTNAFVCQWWALDGDGRAYRYREIYRTQRICEDHARHMVALSKGERIEATVCDHDAEDRATLERHGVPTIAAKKDVSPGIQAVENRLRKAGDGKPRIYFLRDSLVERDRSLEAAHLPACTEEEIASYCWPKAPDGKPLKETPVDVNNHGCDTTRYLCAYLDLTTRWRPA